MIELKQAVEKILTSIKNQELCIIIGDCFVSYQGRAASKLIRGKRLVIIKADSSISIHENRLIRPTNYMNNGKISCEINNNELILKTKKIRPQEELIINFFEIIDIQTYDLPMSNDLRLSGSEKELNDSLMDDLSFLEEGLKPINQQQVFRTGICDIIAEDSEGRLVVIELKRRLADYACVTQLKRYVEQVEKMKGVKTRGILLAPEIRKSAMELLQTYNLEFFSYNFEVGERSKIKDIGKSQMKLSEY
ncbi:MAG: endonuclease NucS [Candidatus ainarchaeum sp.]|nr:endonuclease NucS [Candidatus ainarchaeum sp.]